MANNVSGYLIARENLLPVNGSDYGTFAFYLTSGKLNYSFYCDGSVGANCVVPASSLTDGAYYIAKLTVAATLSFTLQKVTKTGNLNTIGTAINSTTTAKGVTKANADMGVFAGCYSSGSLSNGGKHEMVYIKFRNNLGVCISETYMCNGNANQVTDICNGVNYEVFNEDNFPSFWNHKQDYFHYNFKYGFTLYQKSGSADIRIPNKKDGSEITPAFVPAGYERIANYKECRKQFNQCESLFCLDDVSVGGAVENKVVTGCNIEEINGTYHLVGQNEGKDYWDNDNGYRIVWSAGSWYFAIAETFTVKYTSNAENIWIAESWQIADAGGGLPLPIPSIQTVVTPADDLYSADVDFVLFTESTGVAKNVDIADIYSDVVDSTLDRGHLYINSDSNKNMMLYKTDKGVDTPEDLKIWAYVEK